MKLWITPVSLMVLFLSLGCEKEPGPSTTQSETESIAEDSLSFARSIDPVDHAAVQSYREAMKKFLADKKVGEGWEWFSHRSHGFKATPMILVKLLPELDSEIWGLPSEKFSKFGHFVMPGDENRVLPTSLGMSSYPTRSNPNPIIVTTETCATCHTGWVRLGNDVLPIYGGVNVKFDIRSWRTALEKTVQKHLKRESDIRRTAKKLRDTVRAKPAGFFHANVAEDTRQRNYLLRTDGAESMLRDFIEWTNTFSEGKSKQHATSYQKTGLNNPPNIDAGHPGQVDASGDLLSQGLPFHIGMPEKASLTDIPSVWRQSEYSSGQWDGSVTDQFIRNLAAQIAVVPGDTVDRRVANYALAFVDELPPPPYPFLSVYQTSEREALVARGETLFKSNCADCHKPRNDRYYPQVRTDRNRANVMTTSGALLVGKMFLDACFTTLPDGTNPPSCGNFTNHIRGANEGPGGPAYVAKPLTGIWARAPYLHNGAVPTLRHLLLPFTRPQKFVVGSLSYDRSAVGFAWNTDAFEEFRALDPNVSITDTIQDGLSNQGHDQDVMVDGKIYRLDWTKDEGDAEALIEYLKTL